MPAIKKVVYLIGTGASHAELKYHDSANTGILMSDIVKGVFDSLRDNNENDVSLRELLNILEDETNPYKNVDIESLITLYEATGTAIDKERSNKLKKLFREAIISRINKVTRSPGHPTLLSALLDMHTISELGEEIEAVVTLNYDNFVEDAYKNVYGAINYPFEVENKCPYDINNSLPPICKLHGSFSWENTNPVTIDCNLHEENEDKYLWVPPGVIKRNEHYPFSAIWGAARKALKCDVLRIIGCSLSKNDWNLIALLHTTNRLRNVTSQKYEIEFIDYPQPFNRVKKDFPYMEKLKGPVEIVEFQTYIKNERSIEYNTYNGETEYEKQINWLGDSNKLSINIFEEWLRAKAYYLKIVQGKDVSTEKGLFKNFMLG